jgi:F0F1-type ATP synthase membrane subunit b/b'
MIAEAQEKSSWYDEELRKCYLEMTARKRAAAEEASRTERKRIEAAAEESNKKLEEIKSGILAEKEAAAASLRAEMAQLSRQIAEKVLGRQVA